MSIIRYALKGNLKVFNQKMKKIAQKENCSSLKLKLKFLNCFRLIGCGYSDYLNYELYNKSKKEILEYVSIKDQDKFYEIVSPAKYKTFFTIKPNFLRNFKKYIKRDFFADGTLEELKLFLNKHKCFMIKPSDGLGGSGVKKMTSEDIGDIDLFYNKLKSEKLFLEEYVIQHPEISKLCSKSVNTLRIMTFSYNGKSEILFAAIRIGNGTSSVDNFHQGGMGCLIDLETGKLVGKAFNKELEYFDEHPTSKVKFDGFQIPNWDKVKKMVLEASKVNKNIHVVGWDVAVTKEGATFIEGNRRPGFDLVQVLSKRGRKDIMRHCLDIINAKEGTNYKI